MARPTYHIIKLVLFLLLLTVASLVLWEPLSIVFASADSLRTFLLSFGALAPLALIFLVVLQILLAPVPGQLAGLVSGFLFGVVWGTVYSMIGLILGSYLAFLLSRKLGRPFVEKVVNKKNLKKFDQLCADKGPLTLFLLYLLPAIPDDILCYAAGLTKIRIRVLVLISALGRFPGFLVLSAVGAGITSGNQTSSLVLLVSMLVISFIVYLYRNRLEAATVRLVERFKKG